MIQTTGMEILAYILIIMYLIKRNHIWMLVVGTCLLMLRQIKEYMTFVVIVGSYDDKIIHIIYAAGYGCVLLISLISFVKKRLQKQWNTKWMYAMPVIFGISALIRRVIYLKKYLDVYINFEMKGIDTAGYTSDFKNIWIEITIIVMLIILIRQSYINTRSGKRKVDGISTVTAILFAMLASWAIWELIFVVIYAISREQSFDFFIISLDRIWFGIGCVVVTGAVWKKKPKLFLVGMSLLLLYYVRIIDYDNICAKYNVLLYGYVGTCVLALLGVMLARKKKVPFPNRAGLIIPMVVGVFYLIYRIWELIHNYNVTLDYFSVYGCIANDLAILFALYWVLQGELPLGTKERIENGKRIISSKVFSNNYNYISDYFIYVFSS